MAETYVLDACSVIALLRREAGGEKVRERLLNAPSGNDRILMHRVTLAEVVYDLLRSGEYLDTKAVLNACYSLPVAFEGDLSDGLLNLVAYFKNSFRISFADCFVLALAKMQNATVVTADHHEFATVEQRGEVKFEWIR